jgi:hypothetical protein
MLLPMFAGVVRAIAVSKLINRAKEWVQDDSMVCNSPFALRGAADIKHWPAVTFTVKCISLFARISSGKISEVELLLISFLFRVNVFQVLCCKSEIFLLRDHPLH